jgi:glycosyltransferase involved in cell wall biosynthesis
MQSERSRVPPADERRLRLVVVLPALNEERTVGKVIEQIPRRIAGVGQVQAIVVDDGSTDGTAMAARCAGAQVISFGQNRGNGAAVTAGLEAALRAGADLIVTIDADGQFDPGDIPALLRPLVEDRADFVTCTRFARKDMVPQMPWVKIVGNKVVTKLTNFIGGTQLTDSSCGFRAYTRDTALRMNTFSTFDYAQEALITLAVRGVRLAEVSLPVRGVREFGNSRIAHNLFRFAGKCLSTLLRTMRDFRPLLFFGSIGAVFFAIGFLLGAWVLGHWFLSGETHPYTSFLTGSAVGLLMGVLLMTLALVADSLSRARHVQEEILFFCKKAQHLASHAAREDSTDESKVSPAGRIAANRTAPASASVFEDASL